MTLGQTVVPQAVSVLMKKSDIRVIRQWIFIDVLPKLPFLLGLLKDTMYAVKPKMLEKLNKNITYLLQYVF